MSEKFNPNTEHNQKGPSRRDVIAGMFALGVAGVAKSHEAIADGTEREKRFREMQQVYTETGEISDPKFVFEYLQHTEPASPLSRVNHEISPEVVAENTNILIQEIDTIFRGSSHMTDPLQRLKFAIDTVFRKEAREFPDELNTFWERQGILDNVSDEIRYNREASSLNDVVVNRRMQCRSGTLFFLRVAHELLPQRETEKLVIIYTKGHMLPGYESASGEYTGLEMTAEVTNAPVFKMGAQDQLGPFKVVRAMSALFENQIGQQVYQEKVVLLDVSEGSDNEARLPIDPDPQTREDRQNNRFLRSFDAYAASQSDRRKHRPELYGFGSVFVPSGDLKRSDLESITYSDDTFAPVGRYTLEHRDGIRQFEREGDAQ